MTMSMVPDWITREMFKRLSRQGSREESTDWT
jgi:hypothetical protein